MKRSPRPMWHLSCIVALLAASPVFPKNYCESHGHDYTYLEYQGPGDYEEIVYAPVIWDVRNAFDQLRVYYQSYGWDDSGDCDSAYKAIDLLLAEASAHGVDFADIRSEISEMTPAEFAQEPEEGQYFVELAEIAHRNSMSLIAGGFHTSLSDDDHNDSVVAYLEEYKEGNVGYPEDLVGILGFDEPDARFEGPQDDPSEENWPWHKLVESYAEDCRTQISNDILPFGTFLDRWDSHNGEEYYEQTIPLFCGELEFPVLDRYPCRYDVIDSREYPDQIEFEDIIGATDLLPSGSVDYEAYASSDEIFSVDEDGWFHVYSFANVTSRTDTLEIEEAYSHQLPYSLRTDPLWAASDFRAVDVGDRTTDEHLLNGAVVFLNPDDEEDNAVFFFDEDSPAGIECFEDDIRMPSNNFRENLLACVGEWNYPVHHGTQASRRGGLIGSGEVRILVCSRYVVNDVSIYKARIYGWNATNHEFENVTGGSGTLTLDVAPRSAFWGIFWPSYTWWEGDLSDDRSGFVVFEADGDYQTIREVADGNLIRWEVSEDTFENAFAPDGTTFLARRSWGFRSYTAGMDYLCHIVEGSSPVHPENVRLEFMSGPGNDPEDGLDPPILSEEFTLPGGYEFGDLNDAGCWRPLQYVYDETLLLSLDDGSGGSVIYSATDRMAFEAGEGMAITMQDDPLSEVNTGETPLLAVPRVYGVRRPYRTPIIHAPVVGNDDRVEAPQSDIDVPNSDDLLADQHVALDRMMELGIEGTQRDNCLLPNLRCEGRHQDGQLTFYASEDTLLYLMTTALVHGCRGIHLRALDFTMMCGNGGESTPVGTYRSPSLLLDWGPGVETTDTDMLSRIHGVVRMLTGEGTSDPDFLGALIDGGYSVLDTQEAVNAWYSGGWTTEPNNPGLNFLALEETGSGDILLLVVSDEAGYDCIYFPGRYELDYEKVHIAGYEVEEEDLPAELSLNYTDMPLYTASLYMIRQVE